VTVAERVSYLSRKRKFELFMETIRPGPTTTVVDVGVGDVGFGGEGAFSTENFFEEFYPWPENVTAVGLHDGKMFTERYPDVTYVKADGCSLPFRDDHFDAYFSNAVIEHVGGGDRQRRFVEEAVRVATSVFLTTPNRRFPVEVHTRMPFVHWLPRETAHRWYERLGKAWAKDISLLDARELRALFPAGVGVRIVNLRMTLIAVVSR
jgi:ubiquinone/menaquinone biosynthesis C-methylase UbiE